MRQQEQCEHDVAGADPRECVAVATAVLRVDAVVVLC
jgi:hypothetical protein